MASLLVAGTSSDAGKSVLVAGLCRALARNGASVAPFKAQNMSLNSFVTRDGGEMGRAQAAQARAAGVEPDVRMNPILLKPGSDTRSHLIVLGRPVGELEAEEYWSGSRSDLLGVVVDAHRELDARYDVVICEGAGSAAEINLREGDLVNLGFARATDTPVLLVGDIDRGGVFASFVGTVAVLDPADQALVHGFVVNRFRGDPGLLEPGLEMLEALTGRPTFGVVPYVEGIGVDAEDSIDRALLLAGPPALGPEPLRVTVVALPRMSNHTDFDALAVEPGVVLRFARHPAELADADLVVLPGTRSTVEDLHWMRDRGLSDVVLAHAAAGRPLLGICGGYQMLGTDIVDEVESRRAHVAGLSLLPVSTDFTTSKTVARTSIRVGDGTVLEGYEIHHGTVTRHGADPFVGEEGCRLGQVSGTIVHGLLENDAFRRGFLEGVARAAGRRFVVSDTTSFTEEREARLERLGDLVADHLDLAMIDRLLHGTRTRPPRLRLHRRDLVGPSE
ncbi:MAG: cobyric acid synthase [Microthrixaceae bacterium]